jgi:hypothetical protein
MLKVIAMVSLSPRPHPTLQSYLPSLYDLNAWLITRSTSQPPPAPYIMMEPTPATTVIPLAGGVTDNTGHFVSAIIAQPQLTLPGKYDMIETDRMSSTDIIKLWTKVTGQAVEHVAIGAEAYARIWGTPGAELNSNWEFFKYHPDPSGWGQV